MSYLQILPVLAYLGCIIVILLIALGLGVSKKTQWILIVALSSAFLAFSILTISKDGLIQFWLNHTTNLAGNQVWFDLLLAVTICFYLIAPRAKSVGIRLLPWGIAVFATASLALLPMLARLIWLESQLKQNNLK